MTPTARAALLESVKKWDGICDREIADEGANNCALCQEFLKKDGIESDFVDCPVFVNTGIQYCKRTPYSKWAKAQEETDAVPWCADTPELMELAKAERDFLVSLLPQSDQSAHRKMREEQGKV